MFLPCGRRSDPDAAPPSNGAPAAKPGEVTYDLDWGIEWGDVPDPVAYLQRSTAGKTGPGLNGAMFRPDRTADPAHVGLHGASLNGAMFHPDRTADPPHVGLHRAGSTVSNSRLRASREPSTFLVAIAESPILG